MFELFTALFTIIFTLFAGAALAGHVLLARALLASRTAASGGPTAEPALAPEPAAVVPVLR